MAVVCKRLYNTVFENHQKVSFPTNCEMVNLTKSGKGVSFDKLKQEKWREIQMVYFVRV